MERLKARIPARADVFAILGACALPIHIQAYLVFFHKVPSFLLTYPLQISLEIFAYVQLIALLETLILLGVLLLLTIILPAHFFFQYFRSQSVLLLLAFSLLIFPILYQKPVFASLGNRMDIYALVIAGWVLLIFVFSALGLLAIRRKRPLANQLSYIGDQIIPLAALYLMIDLICLLGIILIWLIRL